MSHKRLTLKDESLIEQVKLHPILYDHSHRLFCDSIRKNEIWAFIANQFKNADAKTCKKKWNILRYNYQRYLSFNIERISRGKQRLIRYKHAEKMRFMAEYLMSEQEIAKINNSNQHIAFYKLTRSQYESLVDVTDNYSSPAAASAPKQETSSAAEPRVERDNNEDVILEDYDDEDEERCSAVQNVQIHFRYMPPDMARMPRLEVFRVVDDNVMIRICGTDHRNIGHILRLPDTCQHFQNSPFLNTFATYVHNDNNDPEGGLNN